MKKTKKGQKKVKKTKKAKPVKRTQPKPSQQIVIRVEQPAPVAAPTVTDLAEPMRDGKKLTIPKTWVSEGQLNKILQVTPRQHVYQKPGKGGGKFDYVTTSYITKALNYIFGWNWDFDVVEHGIEGGQVWVKGRLTVRGTKEGQTIIKTQFGRNDIKLKRDGKGMLDFGNDMKGATSDALKKCASMLGIASDIYGKTDYKSESGHEAVETAGRPIAPQQATSTAPTASQPAVMKPGQIVGPNGGYVWPCEECGDPLSDQVADYSLKMFKKRLCKEHQPKKK